MGPACGGVCIYSVIATIRVAPNMPESEPMADFMNCCSSFIKWRRDIWGLVPKAMLVIITHPFSLQHNPEHLRTPSLPVRFPTHRFRY